MEPDDLAGLRVEKSLELTRHEQGTVAEREAALGGEVKRASTSSLASRIRTLSTFSAWSPMPRPAGFGLAST